MDSTTSASVPNNYVGQVPPRTTGLQPAQGPPYQVPRWRLDPITQPNPRELQEEQIEFLTQTLSQELHDHNTTRSRLQWYLNLYLKHERGQCSERAYIQYLDTVIHSLRTQLQEEKMKRLAVIEEQTMFLQNDCLDNFSCGIPAANNLPDNARETSVPHLVDDSATESPPTSPLDYLSNSAADQYVRLSDVQQNQLDQLVHCEGESGEIHESSIHLQDVFNWTSSPEKFTLEAKESTDTKEEKKEEKKGKEEKQWKSESKECNKRKLCSSTDSGGFSERASKRCKKD